MYLSSIFSNRYIVLGIILISLICLYAYTHTPVHQLFRVIQQDKQLYKQTPIDNTIATQCGIGTSSGISGVSGTLFSGDMVCPYHDTVYYNTLQPNDIQQKQKQMLSINNCVNWGVMTTIHEPTDAVTEFIKYHTDWCVVIVGDKKTAEPYATFNANMIYLSVSEQEQLGRLNTFYGDLIRQLPYNHFGRKNIGYIYAIQHSAQYVWDFDDDNIVTEALKLYKDAKDSKQQFKQPVPNTTYRSYNPYPSMGAPTLPSWPRGHPLPLITVDAVNTLQLVDSSADTLDNIVVYQSLANHDPDVDAIYRLTQPIPFDFNDKGSAQSNNIVVPKNLYVPYNAQATLFEYRALWSLLLPVTVHGRVSDIWRSYITQRLLWDCDLHISFTRPNVKQIRNVHNYLADLQSENDLYMKSGELVEFLSTQFKPTSPTLPGRLEELYIQLYERQYIQHADVVLVQTWIQSLLNIGYQWPAVTQNLAADTMKAGVSGNTAIQSTTGDGQSTCHHTINVLVTGISGLIGSHVARVLVDRPCHRVYGVVRPRSNLDTLVGILHRLELVTGDITDSYVIHDIIEQVQPAYIYHFAAQAINGISYSVPELTADSNVQGTMNLLEGIKRNKLFNCRFILAGSSTEYGRTADIWDGPIPETAPLEPVSPYGVGKASAEMLARQYYIAYKIPIIVARFFIQIGPGGTDSLAIQQFAKQIAMAEFGLTAPIVKHGNLETSRDISDVADSAIAVVLLGELGIPGEAYNVGTQIPTSMSELLQEAVQQSTVKITTQVDPSRYRVYDEKVLLCDNSKLKQLTGWKPTFDRKHLVQRIMQYWRQKVSTLYAVQDTQLLPSTSTNVNTYSVQPQMQQLLPIEQCPFGNIDLFLVLREADFPMVSHLFNSLNVFMPCYGTMHIFCDPTDLSKLPAWIDIHERVKLYVLQPPKNLAKLPGYVTQQWIGMWADTYITSTADYIMYIDTDVVLGLPVTCNSLFAPDGRPYWVSWDIQTVPRFIPSCDDMIGNCTYDYMTTLPLTISKHILAPMRQHIIDRISTTINETITTFDDAFYRWSRLPGKKPRDISQFTMMGNYAYQYLQNQAYFLYTPPYNNDTAATCNSISYLPNGIHYGWRSCNALTACIPGDDKLDKYRNKEKSPRYNEKYAPMTIDMIQDVIRQGSCLQEYLRHDQQSIPHGCTETDINDVHVENKLYAIIPTNMTYVYQTFTPETIPATQYCQVLNV